MDILESLFVRVWLWNSEKIPKLLLFFCLSCWDISTKNMHNSYPWFVSEHVFQYCCNPIQVEIALSSIRWLFSRRVTVWTYFDNESVLLCFENSKYDQNSLDGNICLINAFRWFCWNKGNSKPFLLYVLLPQCTSLYPNGTPV